MPHQEIAFRRQQAVLWAKSGIDRYGMPIVASPIEISVRWNNKRREIQDPQKGTITIDATVIVNMDIAEGSAMWLGTLAELPGVPSTPITDVMYVVSFDDTPDLKNRVSFRQVMLSRDKNSVMPTV